MKTSLLFPALVLAVGMTAGVSAFASDVVKPSPAPVVADSSGQNSVDEPAVIDHVVYLAKLLYPSTPAIAYDEQVDLGLASEVRRACAFYELAHRLPIALPRYIDATLPAEDRRDPSIFDRRTSPRGGRRLWDRRQSSM